MGAPRTSALLALVTLVGACAGEGPGSGAAPVAIAPESTTTTAAPESITTTLAPEAAVTPAATAPATPAITAVPATAKPSAQRGATAPPVTGSTSQSTGDVQTGPHAMVFVGPAPTDPAELDRMADQLATDEAALRFPATSTADVGVLARRQQATYRALSARPAALSRVLPRLPEALRPVAQANVDAGAELRSMTKPKTALPPWRIIAPPPAEELERYYKESEAQFGVPWAYLASIHLVETRMGRIRGTSTAGAQGPMQFLPSTWARWGAGGDINDPRDAILAAGRYLQSSGAARNLSRALWAYNHSDRYVKAVTLYARQIEADPIAYRAYHQWQVYYITPRADLWLEEGYGSPGRG